MHEALLRFGDFVSGGHELTDASLLKRAELLIDEGVVPPSLPVAVAKSLNQADANIRPGISMEVPPKRPMEAIHRVQEDLRNFRSAHGLARVVVINVSSTEPQFNRTRPTRISARCERRWGKG